MFYIHLRELLKLEKKAKTLYREEQCSVVFCLGKNWPFFDIKTSKKPNVKKKLLVVMRDNDGP